MPIPLIIPIPHGTCASSIGSLVRSTLKELLQVEVHPLGSLGTFLHHRKETLQVSSEHGTTRIEAKGRDLSVPDTYLLELEQKLP